MRVTVYAVNQDTGEETLSHVCDLEECFAGEDDQRAAYDEARDEIAKAGRYWLGGGAAALFRIAPLR